jgi:hypothetical protein
VSVQNTSNNAKAGVMIRESLAANSRHAMADVEPVTTTGIEFIWRTNTTGNSTSAATTGLTAPYWIRLTRTNNTFQAYRSPNGSTWTQIGSAVTLSMSNNAYVGLAVCSHAGGLCSSVFDNVTLLSPPPANTAPALNPISNITTNVGGTVTNTVVASDAELSSQTLTFSLLGGPASATLNKINSTNAAFSWRPAVTNANTTNTVTLKVADNGTPILSATQSFWIKVNALTLPTVPSVGWSNGQFTLRVTNSIVGPDYAVQASSNLVNWSTQHRRQCVGAGQFRAGADDDGAGIDPVLRRAGAQQERPRHHDAQPDSHGAGVGALDGVRLQHGVRAGQCLCRQSAHVFHAAWAWAARRMRITRARCRSNPSCCFK